MPISPASPSSTSSRKEFRAAGSLPSAILLALTGGSLDAFIYLNHGHVFAAAMTGNGVLLGVAILHHNYAQAARHLMPILGFVLGVFLALSLDAKLKHHAVLTGLLCEITVLLTASFLPGRFPDILFVPIIAIVAAYQVTSFRRADTYAYNSTFITANLRSAVDGLYDALHPQHRREGLRKFFDLSVITLAFLAGAAVGAILSPRLLNHTLWVISVPLIAVMFTVIARDEQSSAQPGESFQREK